MDLDNLADVYSKNYIDGTELMYIQIIRKLTAWNQKTDWEKLEYCEQKNKLTKKHFEEDPLLPFDEASVTFLRQVLLFLEETENDFTGHNYEDMSVPDRILFRIRNLFFFEKEMFVMSYGIRAIKMHIPLELLEPLIDELDQTAKRKHQIDQLFSIYKKMFVLIPDINI